MKVADTQGSSVQQGLRAAKMVPFLSSTAKSHSQGGVDNDTEGALPAPSLAQSAFLRPVGARSAFLPLPAPSQHSGSMRKWTVVTRLATLFNEVEAHQTEMVTCIYNTSAVLQARPGPGPGPADLALSVLALPVF
eukprot:gene17183-23500_t